MPFTFARTNIPDVVCIAPKVFPDSRGFFAEIFKSTDFQNAGISFTVAQVNHSRSQRNVLRGLHYQLNPKAQVKLVSVVRGEVFDVAVDIRRGSPNFGKWAGVVLTDENKKLLYIPQGFAHGFCVLSETAEIIYYCSSEYAADHERSIIWNDPSVAVQWPVTEPLLSPKDAGGRLLGEVENNFVYRVEGAAA